MTDILNIPIASLHAHPSNSNVMPPKLFDKLAAHLKKSDRYPPVIVRPFSGVSKYVENQPESYQILDGHHRVLALKKIGRTEVRCVVWDVDDAEAMLLLATLNRLQGRDDPRKRAALLEELHQRLGVELSQLARQLPEELADVRHLLSLNTRPPEPQMALSLDAMPMAVHFFLLPEQKRQLESALNQIGPNREEALMQLVSRAV